MGQNSSLESNAGPETRTAEARSRERNSGSLFCSNWTNVNFCTTVNNVQEPVSPNREIEENGHSDENSDENSDNNSDGNSEVMDSGENSKLVDFDNDSGRGSNSVVASLETTSITTNCDTESLRHEQKFFRQSSP